MAARNGLRRFFVNAEMITQVPQVGCPRKYPEGYV